MKVLLTTSGIGSRLGDITKYTNKSLVRVGSKPSISHIIENYPVDTIFVVTLGYYGQHVKDYLELAHPQYLFEFIYVDNYEGSGSCLLYSMLAAKNILNEPFIFHACDTITFDKIPYPVESNWIGGFKGHSSSSYASISTVGDDVKEMHDKGFINSDYLHIGLIGIFDFKAFWDYSTKIYLERKGDSSLGDVDVLKILVKIFNFKIVNINSWHDIGNIHELEKARKILNNDDFHVLEKVTESIYKVNGSVIKFFHDKQILANRVERVNYLNNTVTALTGVRENFYKYDYVDGELFASVANRSNFLNLIKWAESNLWNKIESHNSEVFKKNCEDFYFTKTKNRINEFFSKKSLIDKIDIINDEEIPKISEILNLISKNDLISEYPTLFHGDFILDNILTNENRDDFTLIDWRQDFANSLVEGDMYYDLAKLAHNLVVNHELVDHDHFSINFNKNGKININIHRLQTLVECEKIYFEYLIKNNYNLKKVKILRAIIWLNMSPLHHHPFDLFLFYFGKYTLYNEIKN